jgi:hypothetical protein
LGSAAEGLQVLRAGQPASEGIASAPRWPASLRGWVCGPPVQD